MSLIFDIRSARLYETWYQSPWGKAMDSFVEKLTPSLLNPQPGERILDIGCGSGNHLLIFNKLGLDISGVDASPYMVSMARERLGDRCLLKTGTAEDLPFEDNEFDLAVLINTLEFLDDPQQALREAGRVAKRKIFIVVINSLSWYWLFQKIQCPFQETLLNHVRPYNLWKLKSSVQAAYGRVPIEWESTPTVSPLLRKTRESLSGIGGGVSRSPFSRFLGLSATIVYTVKTDNLPLKIRVKETGQSVAEGITSMGSKHDSVPPQSGPS